MKRSRSVLCAVVLTAIIGLLAPAVQAAPIGSIFDPYDYGSLGALNLTTGTIAFDTDALTVTGFSNGVAAQSAGGGVEMALITFDSVSIGSGVTVNVTGNRGLVLASHSDLTFDSTLSLDGAAGSGQTGGAGGPGSEGGVAGVSFSSVPPGATRGKGGDGGITTAAQAGVGYGGGLPAGTNQSGGGGGGYGGNGAANGSPTATGGSGGVAYGDSVLTELYGGSGGAGGRHVNNASETKGGGGGGGAMELVAIDTLRLNGTLSARGGDGEGGSGNYNVGGGGGSGGGIILAAGEIEFNGTIDVRGGAGGDVNRTDRAGGGGGGGRVLFASNSLIGTSTPAGDTLVAGGAGPDLADDGAPGTVQTASAPVFSPIVHFQEGVSPSVGYVADSVTIRADRAGNEDNDSDFENLVGRVGSSGMRTLFEFDLTQIETRTGGGPVTINSVELNLVTRARDDGSGQGGSFTADLHEYDFDFIESGATWNDPDGGAAVNDPTAGGTLGTVLVSMTIDPSIPGGSTITFGDSAAFRTAVLNALAGDDNTLRLLLKMRNESGAGNNFISVRDEVFATAADRPELVVDAVPEPGTLALVVLGGLAAMRRRRR